MILISHRGNLNGKTDDENKPKYIEEALSQGFDVEVDVWYDNKQFYLGHDEPQYLIQKDFLNYLLEMEHKELEYSNKDHSQQGSLRSMIDLLSLYRISLLELFLPQIYFFLMSTMAVFLVKKHQ